MQPIKCAWKPHYALLIELTRRPLKVKVQQLAVPVPLPLTRDGKVKPLVGSDLGWKEFCPVPSKDMCKLSKQLEDYVVGVQGVCPKGVHGRCKVKIHQKPLLQKRPLHNIGCSKPFAFWARAIHLVVSCSMRPQDILARQVMAAQVWFFWPTELSCALTAVESCYMLSSPQLFDHIIPAVTDIWPQN